jgi:hypothetical protein
MHTIIANDMGKNVALGTKGAGVHTCYCGLHVGVAALPETDGYCGPFEGEACRSCQRFAGGVSEEHMELLKLRAVKAQCEQSLVTADRQRRSQEAALRRELDAQTKLVRRLEADKQAAEVMIAAGQKRIRELEAGAAGDEWTRMCDDTTVWPVLYKAVARGFHPDKTGGDAELEAFFKVAADKNDAFNGKGKSAAAQQQKGCRMTAELLEILGLYGLQSEEMWLREKGVLAVEDFVRLNENDIEDRGAQFKRMFARIKVTLPQKSSVQPTVTPKNLQGTATKHDLGVDEDEVY